MLTFDHIAVAARTVAEGVAYVQAQWGITLPPGGQHPVMGTHNHLARLGGAEYLEVIAVDPAATVPARPRWFNLDRFDGPPQVHAWVVSTLNMDAALTTLAQRLPGVDWGRPVPLSRGDLRWRMAVRDDGSLPWDGALPLLIEWPPSVHPAPQMAPSGRYLDTLTITHPRADQLRAVFTGLLDDPRVWFEVGAAAQLGVGLVGDRR